jgi:hypothetical protein
VDAGATGQLTSEQEDATILLTMESRTKTEPMPFLQQEGAGRELLTAMRERQERNLASEFADDEPTRPMGRVVKEE